MFLLSYGHTFIFVLFIHLVIHSLNKYLLSTFNVAEKILLSKDKNKVGTQGQKTFSLYQKACDLVEERDTHKHSGMHTSTHINNNFDALRAVNFTNNFQKMHIKKFLILVETI